MKVPLDESDRLIFVKKRFDFFGGCRTIVYSLCIAFVFLLVQLVVFHYLSNSYYQKGVSDGIKQALDTRTPSEELEIACAGLWVGEQNKKQFNRK